MGLSPHYTLTIGHRINTALSPWAFIIPHYKVKVQEAQDYRAAYLKYGIMVEQ